MVSTDCRPLAPPATSKDPMEQQEHRFLDPYSCKGRERHRGGGQAGAECAGFSSNGDAWPGDKVAGWGCLCPRSP